MKNKTRWLRWFPALLLLAAPALAQASPGPVGRVLQGATVDPQAQAMLQVSAPQGGYVMVHRNNRILGLVRGTQIFSARSGQRFRLAAVQGSTLVSSLTVVARAGQTAVAWPRGVAAVRYRPMLAPAQRVGPRRRVGVSSGFISHRGYRQLSGRVQHARSDRQRLALLRPYATRYRFQAWQARSLLGYFRQNSSRAQARSWLLRRPQRGAAASARTRPSTKGRAALSGQRRRKAALPKQHRLRIRARGAGRLRRDRGQG